MKSTAQMVFLVFSLSVFSWTAVGAALAEPSLGEPCKIKIYCFCDRASTNIATVDRSLVGEYELSGTTMPIPLGSGNMCFSPQAADDIAIMECKNRFCTKCRGLPMGFMKSYFGAMKGHKFSTNTCPKSH